MCQCFQVTDEFKFSHFALGSPDIVEAVAEKADYNSRRLMEDLMKADAARHHDGGSGLAYA